MRIREKSSRNGRFIRPSRAMNGVPSKFILWGVAGKTVGFAHEGSRYD